MSAAQVEKVVRLLELGVGCRVLVLVDGSAVLKCRGDKVVARGTPECFVHHPLG